MAIMEAGQVEYAGKSMAVWEILLFLNLYYIVVQKFVLLFVVVRKNLI